MKGDHKIKNNITGSIKQPIEWLLFTSTKFGIIPIAVETNKISNPVHDEK